METSKCHGDVSLRLVAWLAIASMLSACTYMRPLALESPETNVTELRAGDEIKIITTNREVLEFEIIEVSDIGVSGDDVFVAYTDMQSLEVKRINVGATVAIVLVSAGLVELAILNSGLVVGPVL